MPKDRDTRGEAPPALTPAAFHIVLALTDAEHHGYGIMQEVAQRTRNAVRLNSGTLYRTIKQLLAAGLIAEAGERPDPALDDERRRYYRLTAAGRRAAEAEAARLEQILDIARAKRVLRTDTQGTRGGAQ